MPRIRVSHMVWAAVLIAAGAWLGYRLASSAGPSQSMSGLAMARIVDIVEQGTTDLGPGPQPYQVFRVELL
ncbi:MAG TPA: hypothetical protein VFI11_15075, partial [Anaerolineales bacterium]|nr:hypothetical protein [Anaerolineales bacterium]